MAHNVTGANIQDIYDRINDVDESHPLDANTFSDWSMQAGDLVTVKRGEEEYKSPVHNSKLVWRGTPQMTISSTGNKERDAVSKVSRKKYGRGGNAVRSQEYIYKEFHSEDGYLHSVLAMTESYLRTEFSDDMNSLRGEFEITASGLRTEFEDGINSLHGEFEVTASGLRTEFTNEVDSLRGEFEVTASGLRAEFEDGINSLHGELEVTASGLRSEFTNEVDSLRGEFEVTASGLRSEFTNEVDSLRGEFDVTASGLKAEFENGLNSLHGEFEVTASGLRAEFEDGFTSLHGEFETTASGLRSEFTDEINSVSSRVTQQADKIALVVDGSNNIKAAQIALAINGAGSSALISADNITLDAGTTKISDVLTVRSGGGTTFKTDPVVFGTSLSTMVNISQGTVAAYQGFTWNTTQGTKTVTGADLLGMVKTMTKNDSTGLITVTLFDGSSFDFRHAASGGDYVTGDWSGGVLTVAASLTGEDSFIRTFKCGTVSWQNDKKAAYVNVTAVRTNGGSTYDEPDVFQVYVPTTESFNAGRNFYLYSEGWNNSGKLTIGAKDTNSGLVISGKTIDRTVTGGTPSWDGGTVTVPIRAYYGSTPPTYENTNANIVLNLSITDDGNNAVKLKNGISDTGYTYTHNQYSNGYNSAHVKGTWNNNVFTYQKTNKSGYSNSDSVTISSAVAMQLGECYAYATWVSPSSSTPTSIYGTSKKLTIVDSTDNTVKLQSGGTDVGLTYTHNKYNSGYVAGWNGFWAQSWYLPTDTPPSGKAAGKFWVPKTKSSASDALDYQEWTRATTAWNTAVSNATTTGYNSGYVTGWNGYETQSWYLPSDTPPSGYASGKFWIPAQKTKASDTLTYIQWARATTAWNTAVSNATTTGYNNGKPVSGTAGGRTSGVSALVHDFSIKKGDNTTTTLQIDVTSIYNTARTGYYTQAQYDENYRTGYVAGWRGYYNDSHWQKDYYNSGTGKYECWIPSGTVTWNGSGWTSAWDYSKGSNGWFQYSGQSVSYNNRGSFYISAIENMTSGGKRVRITKEYGASQSVPFTVGSSYTFYTKN